MNLPKLTGSILLADDLPDNQILIGLMVEDTGAEIEVVGSGKLAVEAALSTPYDLILMDIHMPDMDGLDATKMLRAAACSVPIVAITANVLQDQISAYKEIGFNDYIAKPIVTEHFYAVLSEYLAVDGGEQSEAIDKANFENGLAALKVGFCARLPNMLEQLRTAKEQRDIPSLTKLAHNLKGTAATFGFPEITEIAKTIDVAFKQKKIKFALSVYPKLISAVEEANRTA